MRWLVTLTLMSTTFNAWAQSAEAVSNKELRCLAMNIYHEARGEPVEGQLAVAMVTMNRVKAKKYPDTVCNVVWQRRQFSWTHDGKADRPSNKRSWRLARKIADFVYHKYNAYQGMSGGALDLTKGALHYYAPDLADPYWARKKEVTRQIGGHVFLKTKIKG